MRKFECAVAFGLVFAILISLARFDSSCDDVRDNVLRLHILANSDSEEDQELKLMVRDRLIDETADLFSGVSSRNDAVEIAQENIELMTKIAEDEIRRDGYDYPVTVEVGYSDFDTRDYGDVSLPAGRYLAVRVLIGEAEGHNWWCVMFPELCVPAASQYDEMSDALEGESLDIVTNSGDYKIEFKAVEIYNRIRKFFS